MDVIAVSSAGGMLTHPPTVVLCAASACHYPHPDASVGPAVWLPQAGRHSNGMLRSGSVSAPVFSKMGFGAWQAICSAVGSLRKSRTRRQKVVPFVSPCVKSNAPGPVPNTCTWHRERTCGQGRDHNGLKSSRHRW